MESSSADNCVKEDIARARAESKTISPSNPSRESLMVASLSPASSAAPNASKWLERAKLLDYLRRAHEAEVVWMNTIRLKEETLQQHFSSRLFPICCGVFWYARDFIEMDFVWLFSAAAERIYLGTGLGSALDQETRGFIITCLSAVIECSAYVEVHLEEAEHIRMTSPSRDADETNDEARVQKIETNIQRRVDSTLRSKGLEGLLPRGVFKPFGIPFPFDYVQVVISLCDVLERVYCRIYEMENEWATKTRKCSNESVEEIEHPQAMHVLACELDSLITSVVLKRLIDELDAYTYTHIRMNCSSLDALYALNVNGREVSYLSVNEAEILIFS